jgi:hypothetical protein
MSYLASNLAAAVNTAINNMQADGDCPDDLQDIARTELCSFQDLREPPLKLPCLRLYLRGQSAPDQWMTKALDIFFEVGAAIILQQRDSVEDSTLDAHWYARALQLALERTWDDVSGVYDAEYISESIERYETGVASTRNRRVVTIVYDLRLRTTRGN